MDQDRTVYIVVDRVGAPYRVLLYQPGIRFNLLTNSKVLSLQHVRVKKMSIVGFDSSIWPWVRKVDTTSLVSGIWPIVLNPTCFSSDVEV